MRKRKAGSTARLVFRFLCSLLSSCFLTSYFPLTFHHSLSPKGTCIPHTHSPVLSEWHISSTSFPRPPPPSSTSREKTANVRKETAYTFTTLLPLLLLIEQEEMNLIFPCPERRGSRRDLGQNSYEDIEEREREKWLNVGRNKFCFNEFFFLLSE